MGKSSCVCYCFGLDHVLLVLCCQSRRRGGKSGEVFIRRFTASRYTEKRVRRPDARQVRSVSTEDRERSHKKMQGPFPLALSAAVSQDLRNEEVFQGAVRHLADRLLASFLGLAAWRNWMNTLVCLAGGQLIRRKRALAGVERLSMSKWMKGNRLGGR